MNTQLPRQSRRGFLQTASVVTAGFALNSAGFAAGDTAQVSVADLPAGAAPPPVEFPHFPDRLHAFVWRNWSLVPAARLARVVGARPADILRLGRAMGLDGPPHITPDQQRRSSITVIRRNWHLLPYAQLLDLLGWTPGQLAYTLREDDFLFVKLGNLKPKCAPIRFEQPDEATRRREGEIARLVHEHFPTGVTVAPDPQFAFVKRLSSPPTPAANPPPAASGLRFCYSYFALYGDPLLDTETDPYPDGFLARLAQAGVNGVWLQAVLYKLAPFPWEPGLSARYDERLQNLRVLVARARRHGIRVFLYLNEPRAMPLSFFASRPELKGVVEGDHAALCTSAPAGQQFLREAVASVCRAVPDLGGFFTITGSENLTNCWSHGGGAGCPRCGRRSPAEVIAEVNGLFADGIRQADTRAQLIVWDWGWHDDWAEDIIRRLPASVALMSVSEWSLPIDRGGVKDTVGEYSISAIGPGPRARRHWAWARQRGLPTIAKIQAGNTWELAAVPWIPALENVARHAANLRAANVDGLMLGWTLGGCPSPNLEVVAAVLGGATADEAMQRVAARRFGPALAGAVVTAWRSFSAAFREFPFDGGVLYCAPQQVGPANPLWAAPTGYHASMTGFPYDDLDAWRAVYPPDVFIRQFEKVADGFEQTLAQLETAIAPDRESLSRAHREAVDAELSVAGAAAIHFRSVANQARFVMARRALLAAKSPSDAAAPATELKQLLERELALAKRLHAIQSRDSRLGFEASNHYFYVPGDLAEKVLNCRDLLDRWLASQNTPKASGTTG